MKMLIRKHSLHIKNTISQLRGTRMRAPAAVQTMQSGRRNPGKEIKWRNEFIPDVTCSEERPVSTTGGEFLRA